MATFSVAADTPEQLRAEVCAYLTRMEKAADARAKRMSMRKPADHALAQAQAFRDAADFFTHLEIVPVAHQVTED